MNNYSCKRMGKEQLFDWINMVSFAVTETALYLDTHPCDGEARKFYHEIVEMRKNALAEYSAQFAPLTLDLAGGSDGTWEWATTPWPWEGGKC